MIGRTFYLFIRFAYIVIDVASVILSIFLAVWLRQRNFPFDLKELFFDTANPFQLVFLTWLVVVLFFNAIHHLYQTRREVVEHYELGLVIRSVFFAMLTVMALVYSLKIVGFPRSAFLLLVLFTTFFFCFWRILKRLFVNYLAANGYNNFNVLIVGAGKTGMMLAQEIRRYPGLGLRIVGFLDDKVTKSALGQDYQVLGTLADVDMVCRKYFVHKIFFTIHPSGPVFQEMLEVAKNLRTGVRVVPMAFDRATGEIMKFNIGYIPILEYCDLGQTRRQLGKRLFDVAVSFGALVCLLPVFVYLAALIKRDSVGPVLFFSTRYGRNGKPFRMWKFRSMVVDAEKREQSLREKSEVDGPIFKIRKDPRVTRAGRFLRKYSLDELPQLFNVLMGDMSLVGPRPLPTHQVEREDMRQLKRLEVRPGITGLWQVRGRSDLPFHRLVKWDAWYINNWSFWLDINILLETLPAVMKGKGAY